MSADQYYNVENIKFFETHGDSEYYALIKAKNKEEARDSELYAYKSEPRLMQRNSLGGKASFLPKHFCGG